MGDSSAENTNSSFSKIFGLSVNEFSLAVATLDAAVNSIEKKLNDIKNESAELLKEEQKIAKDFSGAANTQKEAASRIEKAAAVQKDVSSESLKSFTKAFGGLLLSVRDFSEAAALIKIGASAFKRVVNDKLIPALKDKANPLFDKLGSVFSGIKGTLKNILNTVIQFGARFTAVFAVVNIVTRILETLVASNAARNRSIRSFGFRTNISEFLSAARSRGATISADEALAIAETLNSSLNNSRLITAEIVGDIAQSSKAFGLQQEVVAKFFGDALRLTNASSEQIKQTLADVAHEAERFGLNVSETVESIAALPDLARQFRIETTQGRIELARGAAIARFLGTDLAEIRSFGNAFFDISSAAKTATGLSTLGVQNISATDLIRGGLNNPIDLLQRLLQEISRTQFGSTILDENANQGLKQFAAIGILNAIPQLQSIFSSTDSLINAIEKSNDLRSDEFNSLLNDIKNENNYEKRSFELLNEFVTSGESLEETLERFATNFAQKITNVIQPAFDTIIDLLKDLVNLIDSMPFTSRSSTGRPVPEYGELFERDNITSALVREVELQQYLRGGADITLRELNEIIRENARKQGKEELSSDELILFRKLLEERFKEAGKPLEVIVTDVNGRNLFKGMTASTKK